MYIPEHFALEELVPPSIFNARGEKAWELLDQEMLRTIDTLRSFLQRPVIVNTWHSDRLKDAYGLRQHSGLRDETYYIEINGGDRTKGIEAYLKSYSQHKYGRAFDCKVEGMDAESVRDLVTKNQRDFPFLSAIELSVPWFHGDTRNCVAIKRFNP